MNQLSPLTNEELAVKILEKEKRAEFIKTEKGKIRTKQRMLEAFEYLRLSGYKLPEGDPVKIAEVWASQMSDYIVMYGWDVIYKAIKEFVMNDDREYRQAPNARQIIAEAKKIGYNPDVEYAKRKYEAEIARIEKEKADSVAEELTPTKREELMKRFPTIATMIEGIYED